MAHVLRYIFEHVAQVFAADKSPNRSINMDSEPMTAPYYTDPATSTYKVKPVSFVFSDDGLVPNNPLPFLLYKSAIAVDAGEAEDIVESLFLTNGWAQTWRNGIFDYCHYHATVHEVLGVASGRALVRFGGAHGEELELRKGDVAILPAGTGHQRLSASADFRVVGAYPPGPEMEITRPTPDNYRKALLTIPKVVLPVTDPVYGPNGPLVTLWAKPAKP